MDFDIGDKVSVPQQMGYSAREGTIIQFLTNSYGVRCAKVVYKNGETDIVAISSLVAQREKESQAQKERQEMLNALVYNSLTNICEKNDVKKENEIKEAFDWFMLNHFDK